MKKTKTYECFFTSRIRCNKADAKKLKALEKEIFLNMLKEESFVKKVITESRYKSINKTKCKKILDKLILNLIRANNKQTPLIVSLDKNVLSKIQIPLRLFVGIIERLSNMGLIEIHKGFFTDKQHRRTRLTLNTAFKDLLIKYMIVYQEWSKVKLVNIEEVKDKIKFVFADANGNKYAKFYNKDESLNTALTVKMQNDNSIYLIKLNNHGKIVEIK